MKKDKSDKPKINLEDTKKDEPPKKNVKHKKKGKNAYIWPIKIFVLALSLSLLFSVMSEFVLSSTGIILASVIILILIIISIVFDMLGVAVTAAEEEPFRAMAAKKVKGAKEAIFLIKHADKVGSLCNDVIGDICGIISGACGAAIVMKIALMDGSAEKILIASSISALIAGLTILGKALGKKFAIEHSTNIVHRTGKILSIFTKNK